MKQNDLLPYSKPIATATTVMILLITMHGTNITAQLPPSNPPITEYAKLENERLKSNSTFPLAFEPVVNVEYESNQTLILTAKDPWLDSAGRVIDLAKQRGYLMDSVTTLTESTDISGKLYFDHWLAIFMSKR